jgi:hypothetical protein
MADDQISEVVEKLEPDNLGLSRIICRLDIKSELPFKK